MAAENASAEKKSPKIISFINRKGGVGKTTLAANTAALLAKVCHKHVLLVDMDSQASLTAYFVKPEDWQKRFGENTIKKWFDGIIEPKKAVELESLIHSVDDGKFYGEFLDIIPSDLNLIDVEMNLASTFPLDQAPFGFLRKQLRKIAEDYDFVLVDCPPSLDIIPLNAVMSSDGIIVPTMLDSLSTNGMQVLVNSVRKKINEYKEKVSDEQQPNPKILAVVPTMTRPAGYTRRDGHRGILNYQRDALDKLKKFLSGEKIHCCAPSLTINTEHTDSAARSHPLIVRYDILARKTDDPARQAAWDFMLHFVDGLFGMRLKYLDEKCLDEIYRHFGFKDSLLSSVMEGRIWPENR